LNHNLVTIWEVSDNVNYWYQESIPALFQNSHKIRTEGDI